MMAQATAKKLGPKELLVKDMLDNKLSPGTTKAPKTSEQMIKELMSQDLEKIAAGGE